MGLFGCDYLETSGTIIVEYRCKYSRQVLSKRTAEDICMTNRHQDCSDYKNASRCFITTAVCLTLGKPDHCEELSAMRTFRDQWLRDQPGGSAIIEEYYATAPDIVSEIDKRSDRKAIYADIYEQYIKPCVANAKKEDYNECKRIYLDMVHSLKATYCPGIG